MFNFESEQAKILPQFDPNLKILIEFESTDSSKFIKLVSSKILSQFFWGRLVGKLKLESVSVYYILFGHTNKISEMSPIPIMDNLGNSLNLEDSSKFYHNLVLNSHFVNFLAKPLRRVI